MNFVKNVYLTPDTPAKMDFYMKLRARNWVVNRELGRYYGRGADAWDDELQVGDELSSQERVGRVLAEEGVPWISDDAETVPVEERAKPEYPLERESVADREGIVTALDRAMDRTLYLVVKGADGWGFPRAEMAREETLHGVCCADLMVKGHANVVGADGKESPRAIRRRQHEHVDGGHCAGRAPRHKAGHGRGRGRAGKGEQDVFPQGQDHGGPGGPQGEPVWVQRVQVVDAGGAGGGC